MNTVTKENKSVLLGTATTGWTVWGLNPGGGGIFHTCPDQLCPTQPPTQ